MIDFGVTKISFNNNGIDNIYCGKIDSKNKIVYDFETHNRSWFKQNLLNGKTFCKLVKNSRGEYIVLNDTILYNNAKDAISLGGHGATNLPKNITKRKTFLSYYHREDQLYKKYFENLFGDLMVNKSVQDGDIDSDNSDGYI